MVVHRACVGAGEQWFARLRRLLSSASVARDSLHDGVLFVLARRNRSRARDEDQVSQQSTSLSQSNIAVDRRRDSICDLSLG